MIDLSCLTAEKPYYVVGLARTGLSVVQALQAAGRLVYAYDDSHHHCAVAQALGAVIKTPAQIDWTMIEGLVLSPGIPHTYPAPHITATLAERYQVPILCDVDLFAQAVQQGVQRGQTKIVSVTGTNGKSTTAALIAHLLHDQAQLGGNIGKPVLELDYLEDSKATYVLELSSYQLERVPHLKSDIVVWLNITADHIDRHGSLENYVAAKQNIFKPFGEAQTIVIAVDDPYSQATYQRLQQDKAKTIMTVSATHSPTVDYTYTKDQIFYHNEMMLDLSERSTLLGLHNMQNIAVAYAVLKALNVSLTRSTILSFKGLPHRQELCGQTGAIQFINDSKATNIESTVQALTCYDHLHLILGGVPKENGLSGLESFKPKIQHCYLIGQAMLAFKAWLDEKKISCTACETLDQAVKRAYVNASKASQYTSEVQTILLSPACASFDQFKDFEDRGNQFKMMVEKLLERDSSTLLKEISNG